MQSSDFRTMSEYPQQPIAPQNIAPQGDGNVPEPAQDVEPAPITEQEVGEYREQDRFLPVRYLPLNAPTAKLTDGGHVCR